MAFCRGSAPAPRTARYARRGVEGHAAWLRSYRRGTTGATARGSGADSCYLYSKDRHSATGLMARNKGQRGCEPALAFCRGSAPAPHTAPIGRGTVRGEASWLRSYRRSATGLAARGSGVDSCYLHSKDRHSATGLMARNKGQRGCEPTLVFLQGQFPCTPDCILLTCGLTGLLRPYGLLHPTKFFL